MDVPSIMDYGLDLTASRDHVMEDRNGLLESIWTSCGRLNVVCQAPPGTRRSGPGRDRNRRVRVFRPVVNTERGLESRVVVFEGPRDRATI